MFTLLAMTLERHKAIMTPLAPRKSHKTLWVKNINKRFDDLDQHQNNTQMTAIVLQIIKI